jgi:Holliday junction resolvase RusA-like endonuclease
MPYTKRLVYSVYVEGQPRPQPRPRKGRYGNFYNPDSADSWKEAVQAAFMRKRKPQITGPVYLRIRFFFHKEGVSGELIPHTVKPDKDNLEKAVMDALTDIKIWRDDCQVYGGNAAKYWTPVKSGALIEIEAEE